MEPKSPNILQSDVPLNTLEAHYAEYFASPRQLEWYEVSAIDKSRNIMTMTARVPHKSVLDVGAGNGSVLHRLDDADFGDRLCAAEISASGLKEIRSKSWKHLEDVQAFDGYALPFATQSFDLVVLSHVIEHVEHPRLLLREAARVGRHVYIEVPLEYRRTNRRLWKPFQIDATGHINFYNPTLIRLLVESAGLRVIDQQVLHYIPEVYTFWKGKRGLLNYWIKHIAFLFSRRLASIVFNYHCGLLCAAASMEPMNSSAHPNRAPSGESSGRRSKATTSSSPT